MRMLERLLRIWKADLHDMIDQLEDRELLFKQYLREMAVPLRQKQARCDYLAQSGRQIQQALAQRREEKEKLDRDVELAVQKDRDDIARALIYKRGHLEAGCRHLQQQLRVLEEERQELDVMVTRQQLQYDQLKLKVDARLRREQFLRIEPMMAYPVPSGCCCLSKDEVELELLQCKEAVSRGGDS